MEIEFATTEVESVKGRVISCNYLNHPGFSKDKNLYQTLHYVFIQYCPTVSHANGYLLRSALNAWLDYASSYDQKNPEALRLSQYTDISVAVFLGFVSYLNRNELPLSYAEKFRAAMSVVAKNTGKIPKLTLPAVKTKKDTPKEPLTDEAYEQLTKALQKHTELLYKKLDLRNALEAVKPYTYEELCEVTRPQYDRKNIFRWYQYHLANKIKVNKTTLTYRLRNSNDPEMIALSKLGASKPFQEFYRAHSAPYLLERPVDPFSGVGIYTWVPDDLRTLKTLITAGYPFSTSLEVLNDEYSRSAIINFTESCNNSVKILLYRYTHANRANTRQKITAWDELLGMYYPTGVDMAALLQFLMIQSGWNKETVLSIDPDNFEHILSGAVNENLKMLFGEKQKSQSIGKEYEAPAQILATSNSADPYAVCNLVRLAEKLSEPLLNHEFDVSTTLDNGEELSKLFLFLRAWGDFKSTGGRHGSISFPKSYHTAAKQFFDLYPVYENGKRLVAAKDIARRLRPTWSQHRRRTDPLSIVSLQMGHAQQRTTDIHYDSSGAAMQRRRVELRSALEEIMDLLGARKFEGLLGKRASELANVIPRFFHIPGHTAPLWGCMDQTAPSWPGADRQLREGQKCFAIEKCLGCDKVWVTTDSLPYLHERLSHIEQDLYDRDESGFTRRLSIEKEIIEFLFESWDDQDAVLDALRFKRRQKKSLLPRDMAALRMIFEEEEAQ
ncbi:hypothetical protein [Pseudomonas sp. PWP3-1b2]|uniref:hypothetical protein n=1 Tax=Pseudomonas sp. PWP3-1b2 TaxID=2804656 RepID=UPI003CF6590D